MSQWHTRARRHLAHARDRARERFHVELTTLDVERLGAEIRHGRIPSCGSAGGRRTFHLVRLGDADAYAVFDPVTRCVVTFLTRGQFVRTLSARLVEPLRIPTPAPAPGTEAAPLGETA